MREAHARDFIANPVRAIFLDEEFPEFHTLLDAMEEEVPPVTLPYLSPIVPQQTAALPSTSGQKRRADQERADMADTGASRSGTRAPGNQTATVEGTTTQDEALLPEEGLDPPPTRDDIILAFAARSFLPEPDQLYIGHIATLMALV